MIKRLPLNVIFIFLLLMSGKMYAQSFLNGSFEINTSSACNYNLSNATFTSLVANTVAYGTGAELDILGPGGSCPYGVPECGNWHIGMAYPSTGNPDAFTMQLSAPLIAGNSYTMSFWDQGDGTYPPGGPIQIGVSTVPGATGTPVYTGPLPTTNVWNQRIFTFVAPNNGMYISVEATAWRWTHVDDFVLGSVGNFIAPGTVLGSTFCACGSFMFPFTSTGVYNPGNTYSVLLSDATGSFATTTTIGTLTSTSNADSILCTIPCNTSASNLYQIQIVSSNPVSSTSCSGTISSVNISIGSGTGITVNSPSICAGQTATLTASGATSYTWSAGATVTGVNTADVSPVTTTTYTVTGTTGACTSTAVAIVTVTNAFTVSVNSPTICAGQTANLTATGATTYTWSVGATSTGINTADASPTITTTFTVTGTTAGCTGTAIATITVNPSPTITVNSPTICPGQTANLLASGGTSYTWSAGATATGIATADATPVSTTPYTVTGTTAGCSNTAIATVTVAPSLAVTVNSPTICAGQTANLTATGATSYVWSAGANASGTATATASPVTTTSYTVTGTTGTCTGSAISTVTVNPNPNVVVNSPSICAGQTANLTATGATTYIWTAGATSTGGGNATVAPIVTSSYTVTGTTGACIGTGVATVTVNALPPVMVNSPSICTGQTANLTATGATSYTWTAGVTTSGGGNATATPGATSSYTVTGTLGLCSNTAVATVTVNVVPNVSVTSAIICSGQTASLTASGASTYTWSAGATSTGGGTANASPTFTTVYIVTGANGSCSDTAQATVIVNNCIPPFANFVGNPKVMCDSGCVNFSDISMNTPTSWTWQFPGGVPPTATGQGPVQICYNTIGQYDVTLIVSNAYGTDTLTRTGYISVVPPIPVTITGDTYILPCESSHLTANPPGSAYYWGPSVAGSCNICQEAIVTPVTSQPYYCEYTDVNGCHSADTILINVSQHYTYFMPTAFSPNADRINDVLYLYGVGIDNIQLDIYDRVGEKVFETSDILKGWDGTYLGVPLNEGSFVYALVVTYCNGNIIKENGSVLLEK